VDQISVAIIKSIWTMHIKVCLEID